MDDLEEIIHPRPDAPVKAEIPCGLPIEPEPQNIDEIIHEASLQLGFPAYSRFQCLCRY